MKIIHWNIEGAASGQNRQNCVIEIINILIDFHKPDFVHICENCKGGGVERCFDTDYSLKEYQLHIGHKVDNQKTQAVFFKKKPQTICCSGSERIISFEYEEKEMIFNKFIFAHVQSATKKGKREKLLSHIIGASSFIALGDWNKGNDYNLADGGVHSGVITDRLHSRIVNKKNRFQFSIDLTKEGLKLNAVNDFIESTLFKKNKVNAKIVYSPDGWNDFMIATSCTANVVVLHHYTFGESVLVSDIGGKKKGIAPSNHTPIVVEVEVKPQTINQTHPANCTTAASC